MALRILHVVPGLGLGGAEANLVRLLEACAHGFEHRVIDLGSGGPMLAALQGLGVPVVSLNLGRRPVRGLLALRHALRDFHPEIIQGWLYKGNLLATIAGVLLQPQRLLPSWWTQNQNPNQNLVPVLWSVRHSLHAWRSEHPRLRLLVRLLGNRPFRPNLVIYNAASSQQGHANLGYARYPSVLLGNFVSFQRFRSDPQQRQQQREAMGLADDDLLVGFVGRLHKLKNLPGFLAAAQRLQAQVPNVRFVLAGQGLDTTNPVLRQQLAEHQLTQTTQLLGPVAEPAALYNALDLLISPSLSEANSNVLLEAAACGCACVATDVGAAAQVLAPAQRVAGAQDAERSSIQALADRLASAALPLLQDVALRRTCAQASQQQVVAQFDEVALAAAYRRLYEAVAVNDIESWAA